MGLIDDQRVIGFEQRIGLRFRQQNAVGHQLDGTVAAQPVLKAHLEAHHVAQRGLQLLGNALGHAAGGNAARLRVTNQTALTCWVIELAAPHGQCNLGQLRGLAGAGFAADDDDLVRAQRRHDLVAFTRHWQRLWKLDF